MARLNDERARAAARLLLGYIDDPEFGSVPGSTAEMGAFQFLAEWSGYAERKRMDEADIPPTYDPS